MKAPQLVDKPYVSRQTLEKENQELKEMIHDLFTQSCFIPCEGTDRSVFPNLKYDHMCLSTYERTQDKLIEWGLIKPEECSRP